MIATDPTTITSRPTCATRMRTSGRPGGAKNRLTRTRMTRTVVASKRSTNTEANAKARSDVDFDSP